MRQNVDPAVWGPAAWAFLNYAAKACDESSAESYREFIQLLPAVLPCEQCRGHSAAYISENPVETDNLEAWLARFQAAVSKRKGAAVASGGQGGRKGCSRCVSSSPRSMGKAFLLVVGILLGFSALLLLIAGLVKLTRANEIK